MRIKRRLLLVLALLSSLVLNFGNLCNERQRLEHRADAVAFSAGVDTARALNLLDEKTRVVQVSSPEVINALADFYDSLNPAQQAEVREFLDKRRGWFRRG